MPLELHLLNYIGKRWIKKHSHMYTHKNKIKNFREVKGHLGEPYGTLKKKVLICVKY